LLNRPLQNGNESLRFRLSAEHDPESRSGLSAVDPRADQFRKHRTQPLWERNPDGHHQQPREPDFDRVAGVDCKWRTTNADLGTLKGGADPTLEIKLLMARNSICWPELMTRWTATFTFTNPIYVEPS
jgi:hypothetical protein